MANKTIPQLQPISSFNANALFPLDTGTQTFKATAQVVANSLRALIREEPNLNPQVAEVQLAKMLSAFTGDELTAGCGKPWYSVEKNLAVVPMAEDFLTSDDNGASWDTETQPMDTGATGWTSVGYSPQLDTWVAVGIKNAFNTYTILAGSAPASFAQKTNPVDKSLFDVKWADWLGLFVAVGVDGTILTSPTGDTWTQRTSPSASNWVSLAPIPELGLLVAVANFVVDEFNVMYSSDGVNWTGVAVSTSSTQFQKVVYSKKLGLVVAGGDASAIYSDDGINWVDSAPETGIAHITWAEELGVFLAVATTTDDIKYSYDAETWTTVSGVLPTDDFLRTLWIPQWGRVLCCNGATNGTDDAVALSTYIKKFVCP